MTDDTPIIPMSALPMPAGLPLLGNALQIQPTRIHRQLEEWARQLGSAYRLRLGAKTLMVMTDPALIREALHDRPARFGRPAIIEDLFTEVGLNFLFSANGEQWKSLRRLWLATLNRQQLKPFHDDLQRITGLLLQRWRQAAAAGAWVDVQADLMRYTVDITMRFALGHEANTLADGNDRIQHSLNVVMPVLGGRNFAAFKYWRWFRLPADRALDRALRVLRGEVQTLIEATRNRMAAEPLRQTTPGCFLEALLMERDHAGAPLSDDEVFANVVGVLVAGEDTTANTLAWCLHYLSHDPATWAQLRDEADRHADPHTGLPHADSFPTSLPVADAVMNEAMRLRPVAPLMGVVAVADTRLGRYEIPAGTEVIFIFRPAADSVPDDEQARPFQPAIAEAAKPGQVATLPFGHGPRLCPGRNLAIAEIRSVLLGIAANLDLEADVGKVDEVWHLTLMPTGLRLRFQPRSRIAAA